MTFFNYLDGRFRKLSIELQSDFTIAKEGELKAAYGLIQGQRTLFKYLQMPVLIMNYLLINLGWKKVVEPEMKPTSKPKGTPKDTTEEIPHPVN